MNRLRYLHLCTVTSGTAVRRGLEGSKFASELMSDSKTDEAAVFPAFDVAVTAWPVLSAGVCSATTSSKSTASGIFVVFTAV